MSEDTPSRLNGNGKPDPSANVLALVRAGLKRQDDLRKQGNKYTREMISAETKHTHSMGNLRAWYDEKLRVKESARIDANRAGDAAQLLALATTTQTTAGTLAATVEATAVAVRTTMETTARTTADTLKATVDPILKALAEVQRIQYEQAGSKAAVVEAKDSNQWMWATLVSVGTLVLFAMAVLSGHLK